MSNQASLGDISTCESSGKESENSGDDWTSEKIGDIFEGIKSGGTPKRGKDKYWEEGTIPFVKIEDLNRQQGDGISDAEEYTTQQAIEDGKTRIYDPGTILLTIYGTLGETGIVTEPVSTNQGIIGLWDPKDTNIQFARYALDFEQDRLASKKRETTQANIGKNILKLHEIPHPPIDEQRRIASVLYNVDQAISKTEEIIEQTQRVKKGLMQDLFTEGYYSHEEFEESRTGPIKISKPENWELKTVSDLFKIIDGDRGKNYPGSDDLHEEGHCLFLNAGNVTSEGLKFHETEFVTEEKDEAMRKGKLDRGDLILTTRGTVGNIGFYSQDVEYDHMRINSGMVILRPEKECSRSFFYHFFKSEIFQKQIDNVSYGTAQPQISVSLAKKLEIVVPEVEEQEKIAETLDNLDEKIEREKEEKEQLQRLKKGLMQDLLTGSVRTGEDVRVLDEVVEVEG
ncbi:MAG: restriction endonuclease subunit S [Candidatus Nanohalobium sp.]